MKNDHRDRHHESIYFTLKAYSSDGNKLQFDLDFNVPFSTDPTFQHPTSYISPSDTAQLKWIFGHILETYRFIKNPPKYKNRFQKITNMKAMSKAQKAEYAAREKQQQMMLQLNNHSGGNISRIIFNQNSKPLLNVSFAASTSGNGDQRPPNA